MAYEQRPNTGSLFINKRKESDRHPDRTGEAMIGGKMYRVAGWLKDTKAGDKWLSLSFTPKDDEADAPGQPSGQSRPAPGGNSDRGGNGSRGFDDMDDDIPF